MFCTLRDGRVSPVTLNHQFLPSTAQDRKLKGREGQREVGKAGQIRQDRSGQDNTWQEIIIGQAEE